MGEKEDQEQVGPIGATWLGFSLVALTVLVVIGSRPIAVNTFLEAWQVILISAGHCFALGTAAMGLVAIGKRLRLRKRLLQALALAAIAAPLGVLLLPIDIAGVAQRLSGLLRLPLPAALVVVSIAFSLVLPIAFGLGRLLARRYARIGVALFTVALTFFAAHAYAGLYEGLHLFAMLTAGIAMASALFGAPVPARLRGAPRRYAPALLALSCLWGAFSVLFVPSDIVRVALLGLPAAVLAPYPWYAPDVGGEDWVPSEAQRPWFESREQAPPIAPSPERLLPAEPIVILLTIDSFRADVLADASRRPKLPGFFQLRDESVYFTQARTAGSSTIPSLSAMFASAYYSQFYWTARAPWNRTIFLYEDPKERFPELLSRAGVRTATADSTGWLSNQYRIACGFQEEKTVRIGTSPFPKSRDVLATLTGYLQNHPGGPLFLYAHLLDAHSPFDSVTKEGPIFERYVAELGLIDLELRRFRSQLVRMGVWQRTTLIVSADHGEGFLEHGFGFHGQTLYEELVHVPLIVHIPGLTPKVVDEPVSLLDMGPTILDLFGLPTPGAYMGQSLVPVLAGKPYSLTRPIVGEAQLKRSILMPDGKKVIHDTRLHTVQLYDLKADPEEKKNLYDPTSADATARLGMVKKLFEAHTLRKPGYQVPFRKW